MIIIKVNNIVIIIITSSNDKLSIKAQLPGLCHDHDQRWSSLWIFTGRDKRICSPDYSQSATLQCSATQYTLNFTAKWYELPHALAHCIALSYSTGLLITLCFIPCMEQLVRSASILLRMELAFRLTVHSLPLYPTTVLLHSTTFLLHSTTFYYI